MTLAELTTKLASLDKSRAALEAAYESIEFWLFLFTALVVIGLVVEYRVGLKKLFSELPVDWPHAATMVGAVLVVVGVAGELITEYWASKIESGLQTVSTQTERLLFSEAADAEKKIADDNRIATNAAKDAAGLGVTVKNLHDVVEEKEREIHDQLATFKQYAENDKRRANAVIAALTKDRENLDKARDDALASATKAETSLRVVQKAQSDLTAAVATINGLQEQLHELTTDRTIDVNRVAEQLKSFGKLPFAITVSDDVDAILLAVQIGTALEQAGWDWKENKASDNSFEIVKRWHDKPNMRIQSGRGVVVQVASVDLTTLGKAGTQLIEVLRDENLKNVEGIQFDDDRMKTFKRIYGVLHILVGTKF